MVLLQAKCHEASDDHIMAAECYKLALLADVFCYEAFVALTTRYSMPSIEG